MSILKKIKKEFDWMYTTSHTGWPAGERNPKNRKNTSGHGRGVIN